VKVASTEKTKRKSGKAAASPEITSPEEKKPRIMSSGEDEQCTIITESWLDQIKKFYFKK